MTDQRERMVAEIAKVCEWLNGATEDHGTPLPTLHTVRAKLIETLSLLSGVDEDEIRKGLDELGDKERKDDDES